jgi:DNA-binding beta-propeller fold protein YncE
LNASPDREEVFFTEAGVDAVLVLDRATNEFVTGMPVGASPHHPLLTPDGKVGMAVAQRPGDMDLFDPHSCGNNGNVTFGAMPHWIAATSDNQFCLRDQRTLQ